MAASGNDEAQVESRESAGDLGARLRRARESRQLSLEQLAGELRIRADALAALEQCRFETLGPRVFAKGYLKQYGARLGLDVRSLCADFDKLVGTAGVDIAPSRSMAWRRERRSGVPVVAGVIVVVLIALVLYWWFGTADPMSVFDSLFN
jgi:cytoskeleton protein RodZ